MKNKYGIPKAAVCAKCGYDVIDIETADGTKRINATLTPYIRDESGETLYMADGTMVRGKILWPGMEAEPDGYAHRVHKDYTARR